MNSSSIEQLLNPEVQPNGIIQYTWNIAETWPRWNEVIEFLRERLGDTNKFYLVINDSIGTVWAEDERMGLGFFLNGFEKGWECLAEVPDYKLSLVQHDRLKALEELTELLTKERKLLQDINAGFQLEIYNLKKQNEK